MKFAALIFTTIVLMFTLLLQTQEPTHRTVTLKYWRTDQTLWERTAHEPLFIDEKNLWGIDNEPYCADEFILSSERQYHTCETHYYIQYSDSHEFIEVDAVAYWDVRIGDWVE